MTIDPFLPSMRYLRTLPVRMEVGMTRATQRNLALVERTVKRHLRNQDLGWKELSPAYSKRKRRTGAGKGGGRRLSEKTLIATGTLLRSITSEMTGINEGAVGVLRSSRYTDGERIANIAAVHEYGSRDGRIPARPLWDPTAKETSDDCRRNWLAATRKAVKLG